MEILKTIRITLTAGVLLFSLTAQGQDFKATKDAFQQSYIQEATGEITAAINSLKEVYSEKSYEINLRLGWLSYQAGNFFRVGGLL